MRAGAELADSVGRIFGIDSRWIFGCEADANEITIWRGVQGSDGSTPVLFEDPMTGQINDVCRVEETFTL